MGRHCCSEYVPQHVLLQGPSHCCTGVCHFALLSTPPTKRLLPRGAWHHLLLQGPSPLLLRGLQAGDGVGCCKTVLAGSHDALC